MFRAPGRFPAPPPPPYGQGVAYPPGMQRRLPGPPFPRYQAMPRPWQRPPRPMLDPMYGQPDRMAGAAFPTQNPNFPSPGDGGYGHPYDPRFSSPNEPPMQSSGYPGYPPMGEHYGYMNKTGKPDYPDGYGYGSNFDSRANKPQKRKIENYYKTAVNNR